MFVVVKIVEEKQKRRVLREDFYPKRLGVIWDSNPGPPAIMAEMTSAEYYPKRESYH